MASHVQTGSSAGMTRGPDFSFLRSNGDVGRLSLDKHLALFSLRGAQPLLPTQGAKAHRLVSSIHWSRRGEEGGAPV